jgi:double-stranded uracil-DNA glycosylase
VKTGFHMIADAKTRLFILGSLPGDRSLERGQYYAHHSNQFWKLVGALIDQPLPTMDYDERLSALRTAGIGLWDVYHAAHRDGSDDSAIRDAKANALHRLRAEFPRLEAIAFNGGTAAKEGRRALVEDEKVRLYDLPSSSGLNAIAPALKLEAWKILLPHLS